MSVNSPFRVAVLADCHIDHQSHQLDGYQAWLRAADAIVEREVSVVVVAGDMFHQWRVTGNALSRAVEGFQRMTVGGADVVIISGNHEWIGLPSRSAGHTPLEVFQHTPYVSHVLTSSQLVTLDCGLHVAGFPWQHHADTTRTPPEDAAAEFKETLAGSRDPRLCVAHTSVGGARMLVRGAEMEMAVLTHETTLPLTVVDDPAVFTRTALGHIHRRQLLTPTCGYVGSLDQHSFGDEGMTKGFSVYTWDDQRQAWDEELVPVGVHQFVTLDIDADQRAVIDGQQMPLSDAVERLVHRDDPTLPATLVRAVVSGETYLPRDLPNDVTHAGGQWLGWKMTRTGGADTSDAERRASVAPTMDFDHETMISTWVDMERIEHGRRALMPKPARKWLDVDLPEAWDDDDAVAERESARNAEAVAADEASERDVDEALAVIAQTAETQIATDAAPDAEQQAAVD